MAAVLRCGAVLFLSNRYPKQVYSGLSVIPCNIERSENIRNLPDFMQASDANGCDGAKGETATPGDLHNFQRRVCVFRCFYMMGTG